MICCHRKVGLVSNHMCVQVEDAALQEALGRAASQLYVALGERMVGADAESEVVRFKSASAAASAERPSAGTCTRQQMPGHASSLVVRWQCK